MHPYFGPTEQSNAGEQADVQRLSPSKRCPPPNSILAGRSQESDHPLPPSNALIDIFATHRVSINLGKILL